MISDRPTARIGSADSSKRNSDIGPATVVLASLLILGLPQVASVEEHQDLLGDFALPPSPIRINLNHATVRISLVAGEDSAVRWWRARPEEPGTDALAVLSGPNGVSIEREDPPEASDLAELVVEVSAAPGHLLRLDGSGLDLTVSETAVEQEDLEEAAVAPIPTVPTTIEINLSESVAFFQGTGAVTGAGNRCTLDLSGTTGHHVLELTDSETRFTAHRGQATLTALNTSIAIEEMSGSLTSRATGGSLGLRSFSGKLSINQQDGQIQVANSRISGMFVTSGSNIDVRESQLSALNVTNTECYLTADDNTGTMAVKLSGGLFAMDGFKGNLSGYGRDGIDIELRDHSGGTSLDLGEGASGRFTDIRGVMTLNSRNASATVIGAEALSFTAVDSTAFLEGIEKLTAFQVTSSEVELDASDISTDKLSITVQSESRVRIRLAAPCRVQASGGSNANADRIEVTGCELKLGQGRRRSTLGVRGLDGRRPKLLNANVAETAKLIVEGQP